MAVSFGCADISASRHTRSLGEPDGVDEKCFFSPGSMEYRFHFGQSMLLRARSDRATASAKETERAIPWHPTASSCDFPKPDSCDASRAPRSTPTFCAVHALHTVGMTLRAFVSANVTPDKTGQRIVRPFPDCQ